MQRLCDVVHEGWVLTEQRLQSGSLQRRKCYAPTMHIAVPGLFDNLQFFP